MKNVWRALLTGAIVAGVAATAAFAATSGPSGPAQKIDDIAGNHVDLNTASLDGCPIQAPDGRSLYMASNRPGGKGGLDIWVATREKKSDPWGARRTFPSRSTRPRTTSAPRRCTATVCCS